MDIEAFTEKVHGILSRRFPEREFVSKPAAGVITMGEAQFGMTNLHLEYQKSPVDDETLETSIVEKFENLVSLTDAGEGVLPPEWVDAKPRLRLQLFSRRLESMEAALSFPFSDTVCSSLVIDSPKGYAYVRPEDAQNWDQSVVDLMELAQQNLLDASQEMQLMKVPGETPLCIIQTVDGYDAARVLVPEIRQRLIRELTGSEDGEIYVGVPNRDFLIAWRTDTAAALHSNIANQIATDADSQPYPLCNVPLKTSRDSIQPLKS
jgi:hypothetical protein